MLCAGTPLALNSRRVVVSSVPHLLSPLVSRGCRPCKTPQMAPEHTSALDSMPESDLCGLSEAVDDGRLAP